jgi:hypothetical protein
MGFIHLDVIVFGLHGEARAGKDENFKRRALGARAHSILIDDVWGKAQNFLAQRGAQARTLEFQS